LKDTVVILLSDKRSGSTWFETELCSHSEVQHLHFTPHAYHESHYWVKAACMLTPNGKKFSGNVSPYHYGYPAAARKSVIRTVRGNVSEFVAPMEAEQLIFEGWEALCRQFAQPVFFEKSPQHPHHWAAMELMLKWMQRTRYRVRFIGLVRNPMAMLYSAAKLFYTDPEKRQHDWLLANQNILKLARLVGDDRFLQVRYEDLVVDPTEGFSSICRFIGINHEHHIGCSVKSSSLCKWRDDPAFDFHLDERVAAFAQNLGYGLDDVFNPPKPPAGRLEQLRRKVSLRFNRARSRLYNRIKRFRS